MSYFENYFKFPSVHIDGDYEQIKEERDEAMGSSDKIFNPEYIICETEVALTDDVMFITDAWYPSEDGFSYVRDNAKFPCSRVTFADAGQFLCALSKARFKKLWSEAKETFKPKMQFLELTKEDIENFLTKTNENEKSTTSS